MSKTMSENFLQGDQLRSQIESLEDRGSETLNFPDKTYALGGAGKKIAFEMLENDWFLIELLLSPGSGSDFHIIDTQTETIESDRERLEAIKSQLKNIEDHMQDLGITDTPRVRIEMAHLTEEVDSSSIAHFINDNRVDQILQHAYDQKADTWWVDRETLTDDSGDMNNLSKGAIRRRALSKAFFYKAQSESTTFANDHLNLMADDTEIGLIAGLGGGTGSGMFVDLARYISDNKDNARITMFGVLPSSTEGQNERSNAHAALSEMEYLSLSDTDVADSDPDNPSDPNPFSDIILTPIEVTEHQSNIDENPKLENFDSAFPYVPISYYNNDGIDDLFSRNPDYAPFTIAVPQVFRYNVKEIKQNRDKIKDILESKSKAQDAEERLYSKIESFYNENYTEILQEADKANKLDEVRLSKSDGEQLEERIELIKEFATDEMIAGSNVVDYLSNIFDLDDLDDNSLSEDLENMEWAVDNTEHGNSQSSVDNVNPYIDDQNSDQRSELEKDIISQINGEMHRVTKQNKILQKKQIISNRVNDHFTSSLISFLLDVDSGQEDSRKLHEELGSKMRTIENKIEEKETKKQSLEKKLEKEKDNQKERINNLVSNWERNVNAPLDRLEELESLTIRSEIEELESKLRGFTNSIRDAPAEDIANEGRDIEDVLDELKSSLRGVDLPQFKKDRTEIIEAIQNVRKARKRWMDCKKTNVTDYIPYAGGDATKQYDNIASKINNNQVFSVPGDPETQNKFQVNFVYEPSFVNAINTEKENIHSHLKQMLEEVHQQISSGSVDSETEQLYTDAIENRSGTDRRESMKEIVNESIKNKISDIQSVQEDLDRCTEEIANLEEEKERVEAAEQLFSQSAEDVITYRKGQKEFRKELQESSIQSETVTQEDNEFTNVGSPITQDTFQDESLSEAGLLKNDEELQRVRDFYRRATEDRLLNSNYNGLVAQNIVTQNKKKEFNDTILNISIGGDGILSEENIRSMVFDDQVDRLRAEFGLQSRSDGLGYWSVKNGGPWDVAMCMFIQGISFMDNLSPVTQPTRGYLTSYNKDKSNKSRVHRHSYGLERGFFVNRKDIIPVNNNRGLFVKSTQEELVEEILSEYENLSINNFMSKIPMEDNSDADEESEKESSGDK